MAQLWDGGRMRVREWAQIPQCCDSAVLLESPTPGTLSNVSVLNRAVRLH